MDSKWTENNQGTKFRSIDQDKLNVVCDSLCNRITDLLSVLNIDSDEYTDTNDRISMCCPIHGGDNPSALNLYHTGDSYRGNWKCRTHQCEKIFLPSIVGFIRGVLSKQKLNWKKRGDDTVSFKDTMLFAMKFLSIKDINSIKVEHNPNASFVKNTTILNTKAKKTNLVPRSKIVSSLQIPSKYFLNRGFSKDVLTKYDVGDCFTSGKEMVGRAVAPIYDMDYKGMIGCTGRTINDEYFPKWRHSKGFVAEDHLYNVWFAKESILDTGNVILVESPGNVWTLEQAGIHNSLATFGSHLTDRQKMMLDMTGAMKIITIMDGDEAGELGRKQIDEKCSKTYNIEHIIMPAKMDVAELYKTDKDLFKSLILDRINK